MLRYLAIIRSQQKPWRFLIGRILQATGLCSLFAIQRRGYKLRFFPSNLALQFWIDPNSRNDELDFFRAYLKGGDTVVDVGANIGDTALAMSLLVRESGSVMAIEAHPRISQYLRSNVKWNNAPNVTCVNVAVGATSGEATFSDSRRDDMNHVGAGRLKVEMRRLDDMVGHLGLINLLKIDVEGYEKSVFEGAYRILDIVQCIYFEASETNYRQFGFDVRSVLELLVNAGFKIFRVPKPGIYESIPISFKLSGLENLIAVREERELQSRTGWCKATQGL